MVNKCSAPNCRGNYDGGPKVSVFKFPEDEALRQKWIHFLKREKDFNPSKYARVCELHFKQEDIIRSEKIFDPKTGVTYTAALTYPKLKTGTIPSILLNCPKYFTVTSNTRENRNDKLKRLEDERLKKVINESLHSSEQYNRNNSFQNFVEFCAHLKNSFINADGRYNVITSENEVLFAILDRFSIPKISYSVIVDNKCVLRVFNEVEEINEIASVKLPITLTDLNKLDMILMEVLTLYDVNGKCNKSNNNTNIKVEYYINLIETFIKKIYDVVSSEQKQCIEFLIEQCFSRQFLRERN